MKKTNVPIGLRALMALMVVTMVGCSGDYPPEEPLISPAETFALNSVVMADLQKRAMAGDCDAAVRIAHHHSYFTLDYPETLKWFRIAARCPSAQVKGELVEILITNLQDNSVALEVERLMAEMRALNPKFTADFEQSMKIEYGYEPKKEALNSPIDAWKVQKK